MFLVSIILGLLIYLITRIKRFRTEDSFIGGEKIYEEAGFPAPEFYKTFGEFSFFEFMYKKAQQKWFDIYDLSKQAVLWISHTLSQLHTGVLPGYIIWVFAGLLIILLIMI
jgi:multicomponent Na+:H+ antiporter subunit A